MFAWVLYDITSTPLRQRIADACLDHGLARFQKSIFFGELTTRQVERVGLRITELFNDFPADERTETDSILIFTLCDTCLTKKVVVGKAFNEDEYRKRAFVIL
ncbi:hypothetical protein RJ53_09370 [Methanocalculus chunghsingensis]|uniref:CRISPR-associated endoribonuclease Cas2 n=1 Tax=Methanocalculus chunghsingensis TaxID=156457 RepID=A0A8J8B7H2_9EURY|nr:CRISPR-associated endonuclease Cas2 [Methanocalculus chunghsingensis]MBR1369672.1 hypothetical protein [Methanocalculus chunghsingensis]